MAKKILDNWMEVQPQFIKVFPKDYSRVLAKLNSENKDMKRSTQKSPIKMATSLLELKSFGLDRIFFGNSGSESSAPQAAVLEG